MLEPAALALPFASFLLGLASGVHCIGMCGGIVGAFAAQGAAQGPAQGPAQVPVPLVRRPAAARTPSVLLLASFNGGRMTSYALAGGVAGALGGAGALAAGVVDVQLVLYVLANVFLVLIGLHLAGVSPLLARFEALGAPLWRRIQPLAARLLPADTPLRALFAGSLWGWLPCGLVYGMLATAVAAGSAGRGALTMLAFGLGTVPNLMLAGLALVRLRRFVARRAVRLAAGGLVLGFGVLGLARAADLGEVVRRGLLCL